MGEEENKERAVRKRSPNYPAVDLKSAVARIKQIYENEHGQHFVPSGTIFSHWKYGPKSSSAITTLGALKQFGLLEGGRKKGQFGESKLTDLAMEILLDEDGGIGRRNEALKKAAMRPPMHVTVWGGLEGSLPSDKTLRYRLIKHHGFTETGAADFTKELRSTLAYAGIIEDDKLGNESENGGSSSGNWLADETNRLLRGGQRSPERGKGPSKPNAPKARPGMNQDTFTLEEGQVVLQWPANISPKSYENLKAWLDLRTRTIEPVVATDGDEETESE